MTLDQEAAICLCVDAAAALDDITAECELGAAGNKINIWRSMCGQIHSATCCCRIPLECPATLHGTWESIAGEASAQDYANSLNSQKAFRDFGEMCYLD